MVTVATELSRHGHGGHGIVAIKFHDFSMTLSQNFMALIDLHSDKIKRQCFELA